MFGPRYFSVLMGKTFRSEKRKMLQEKAREQTTDYSYFATLPTLGPVSH